MRAPSVLAVAFAALTLLPAAVPSLAGGPSGEFLLRLPDEPASDGGGVPGWAVAPGIQVVPYKMGLNFPVAFQLLDDGTLWYGEWQTGRVNVIYADGSSKNFVDLNVLTGGEMGLHEVSYHAVDGAPFIYVSYVYGADSFWGCVLCRDRLSRFPVLGGDVAGPEQVLLDLQGGFVHNGGIILWGPDGKLYYSRGDISYAELSQQVNGHAGRVMRLNPDGTVPADNPFGPTNPTWAYGLRHTFGMDWLPGTSLIIGTENSDNRADEVNLIAPGRNYGWPRTVGFDGFPANARQYTPPLRAFERTIGPTNGAVYLGTQLPGWQGQYFYGDTNNGIIYRLVPQFENTGPGDRELEVVVDTPFLIIDVQNGPDGYLYFSRPEGIYRIAPEEDLGLPGARLPNPLPGVPRVP